MTDQRICFCQDVQRNELICAIRKGATTLQRIQDETLACTGCGSCEFEILEILEEELGGKNQGSQVQTSA